MPSKLGDFTTRFGLPYYAKRTHKKAAKDRNRNELKQSAPYVAAFLTRTFIRSITIEDHEGTLCFEVVAPHKAFGCWPNSANHSHGTVKMENANERGYLLSQA